MKQELKRAMRQKSNILIILFVIIMMFVNTYFDVWKTALHAPYAKDLSDPEVIRHYQLLYGNTITVWRSASYFIPVAAPILVMIPYVFSYHYEKENSFRNYMLSRESKRKYLFDKVFAIIVSSILTIFIGEFIFYFITYFLTYSNVDSSYLTTNIVLYNDLFLQHPYLYFFTYLGLRYVAYLSFVIFGFGITSYISNKAAIVAMPFVLFVFMAIMFPNFFVYDVFANNICSYDYNMKFYFLTVVTLIGIGLGSFFITEKLGDYYG